MGANSSSYCCNERQPGSPPRSGESFENYRPDHRKFEIARSEKDVATLVRLLSSMESLPKSNRVTTHPWAKAPDSVGSLVAAHIAVMISSDKGALLTDSFLRNGLLESLLKLLRSAQVDRLHAGSVTFVFLTEKSSEAALKLSQLQVEPDIQRCLMSGTPGLQLTSLSLLRNICKATPDFSSNQVTILSMSVLIDVIRSHLSSNSSQSSDYVLEGLQIMSDFLEIKGPKNSPSLARTLKSQNVEVLLTAASKSIDSDIAEESARVASLLKS